MPKKTLSENIEQAWSNIMKEVEENNITISSEKTLVFKFAIELAKLYNCQDIIIDFEIQLYDEIDSSDKYLDLLVYEKSNPENKFAIEFKAPMLSSNGNSNQTETRKKVYKDIARLKYLKESKSNIQNGYFFMITNEPPYFNQSQRSRDTTFDTSNNYEGNLSHFMTPYKLKDNFNFKFEWKNIKDSKIIGKFAWLKYIKV